MSYGDQAIAATPEVLPKSEQNVIKMPDSKWSDTYAKSIVNSDFAYPKLTARTPMTGATGMPRNSILLGLGSAIGTAPAYHAVP